MNNVTMLQIAPDICDGQHLHTQQSPVSVERCNGAILKWCLGATQWWDGVLVHSGAIQWRDMVP